MSYFNHRFRREFAEATAALVEGMAGGELNIADFKFDFDATAAKATIQYLHNLRYWFRCEQPPSLGGADGFVCVECPGQTKAVQSETYPGESMLHVGIREWLHRLVDELDSEPYVRAIEEHRQRMEQLDEALKDFPEHPASREELDELSRRLDEYERQVEQTLKATADTMESIQETLSKLHAEIEMLKRSAEGMTVKGALRLIMVRLWNYAKSSDAPKEIGNAFKTVKAIGDGISNIGG